MKWYNENVNNITLRGGKFYGIIWKKRTQTFCIKQ